MTAAPRPLRVALLAVPEVSASTLYGFFDTLASAGRHWQMLHGERAPRPSFEPLVVSRDGRPVRLVSGVLVTPDASIEDYTTADIVCVTTLEVEPDVPLGDRYEVEVEWMRERYAGGSTLASACSGAVLLAATGLLDGLDATSHWAYCDTLQRRYPTTRWHPERPLVLAGGDQRIVMSGSGVSWHLLTLHLIARFAGPEQAMQVARMKLMDLNSASPVAYASLKHGALASDSLIARCQAWLAEKYTPSPVAQMTALSGLAERTFKRRFTLSTGMSPLEYVHAVRLEEAKHMLETSDEPVEAIALEVGYQDPGFFSRLFRRKVALTPTQYRRRFRNLVLNVRSEAIPTHAGQEPAARPIRAGPH